VIIDFSVRNFLSFKEEQKISFVASNSDKSLPDNLIDPKLSGKLRDERLLKGLALYGANAAGKSNVLAAMQFLKGFVTNSATKTNEGDEIHVAPFALDPACAGQPSEFIIRFVVDGTRFHYTVALNRTRVLYESLSAFPNGKQQVWFEREWDDENKAYTWGPESPTGYKRDPMCEVKTRSNALYLSTAVNLNDEQLKPVYFFFKNRVHFLKNNYGINELGPEFTGRWMTKDRANHVAVMQMMTRADLGLLSAQVKEIEYKREDLPSYIPKDIADEIVGKKHIDIRLGHKGLGGVEYATIDWEDESEGTKKFLSFVGPWFDIMQNGYCVGIDEIESSFHPMMVVELLKALFESKSSNTPQIIFTTHNPLLLDQTLLRRDQIWFADKDDEGATQLYPLTDYSPRKDESLIRGYMAGRYGAVPFIPEGLLGKAEHGK